MRNRYARSQRWLDKYAEHVALRARRHKLLRTIKSAESVNTLAAAVVQFLWERKL